MREPQGWLLLLVGGASSFFHVDVWLMTGSFFLIVMGVFSKFAAALVAIPAPVLGGMTSMSIILERNDMWILTMP